ncbi:RNA 2',3'-cyclic phosphodiesterase [Solimonas marina]|uniref:RNA 2',3'-cyclic phosphodiesterase n=1 Tax=Solimonas marina TaxID=2714601 RepID=A0A969W8K4_9GAMM|nr:RNA 2',3'-cyclic phosphodiesterase [Solimonas marina]NKF21520.1 RNA 2',3'-cyclic phosphodiesterase [Solimonas marina]
MEPNRLFFALWPGEAVRASCNAAARQLNIRMPSGGYLSSPERYHVTLLFLGDHVPRDQEDAACRAAALVRAAPFTLTLDHAGSFRNREIPWWIAARSTPPGLTAFYAALRDAMLQARVSLERLRFVPHLTIARNAKIILPPTPIEPIDWAVDEFVLIRSRLDLRPVRYEVIGRWPLLAPEGGTATPIPAPPQLDLF